MGCRVSNVTGQILKIAGIIDRSVSHVIGFSHEPFARMIRVSNVTLQILQKDSPPGPSRALENELNLVSYVFGFNAVEDRQVPENTLGLIDSAYPVLEAATGEETFWESVSHDVGFSHSLGVIGPIVRSLQQGIPFSQIVHQCISNLGPYEIEHEINLKHYVSDTPSEDISHTIGFTDEACRIYPFSHTIGFYDTMNGGTGLDISHDIGFSHTVDPGESLFSQVVVSDAAFKHAMTYYFDGGCKRKQYNQFEGTGEEDGIPEAPLTFDAQFALESIEGTKETLYLRNPEVDDKHRVGYSRINRESRGGELKVYQDPSWPKIHTLLFTFTALSDDSEGCPDKIGDLLDFFQDHLGQEIFLHDWEGITWRGVVTTPDEVAVEDRDGWWTISFEFVGEALDGSEGDQNLDLTDAVLVNGEWGRSGSSSMGLTDLAVGIILGEHPESVSHTIGFFDDVSASLEHPTMEDDFSGVGAALHGTSPDIGSSTWYAHTNYLDDGTQTAINGGAYYPFAPVSGKVYDIEWETSAITESNGLETRCFLGEGLPSDPDNVGGTAYGNADPTTLKAGFVLRDLGGTQDNACRLGDESDGEADTASFTDGTLKTEDDAIDLRLELDTTGGAGNWLVTWYAKDPASSDWTEVRAQQELLDEDITMAGWSNDNSTTTITMDDMRIVERTDV